MSKKGLIWPSLAVTLPLVLLSSALLGLVYGYQVDEQDDAFLDPGLPQHGNGTSVILVNLSASKNIKGTEH